MTLQLIVSHCRFPVLWLVTLQAAIILPGQALYPNNTNLTFMLITSFGQFGFNSSGGLPAAEMALEDINNSPDVLPGYNLIYDRLRDSQCHRGRSLDTFFRGILSEPVKIAVVGCGCSVATEPVAEISYQWNITQVSYSSGSPALDNRERFRKYFRNSPSSVLDVITLKSTISHFNWTRIAVLTQDEPLFTIAESRYREQLKTINVTVDSRTFQTDEDPVETEDLFVESEDYRVFMLNSYSGPAKKIICEAQKRNYTYPRYAWITYHWYPRQWWTESNTSNVSVSCTEEELESFLGRVLTIQRYETLENENATTEFGRTLGNFEAEYKARAKSEEYDIIDVRFRIYDALWALALALNQTMTMVESLDINGTGCESMNGPLVPLHQFDYTNAMMGCLIQWNLQQTNFSGMSGHVKFDENGTRIQPKSSLFQYRLEDDALVRRQFAFIDVSGNHDFSYATGESETQVYPDGTPPDGSPQIVIHTFHVWLIVVFYLLTAVGLIFAVICLLFNLIFRKTRLVKLSSPNLNYFIITGAALMYVSIYLYLIPVKSTNAVQARCLVEHWLFTIGYSLAFGTVLAKMWRVYQIFNNPKLNKKVFKDWHLLIIILVITGVSVALLFFEAVIPQLRGSVTREKDLEDPSGRTALNVSVQFYVLVCNEGLSPNFLWQILIYIFLAVLQIVGILLAFQTRKVKLHGLRDSKFIAAVIYISSIVLVVLALVTFTLRLYINIQAGMYVSGVIVLTTVILSLIFTPKMVMLYRDPEGESVGKTPSLDASMPKLTNQSMTNSSNVEEKMAILEKSVQEKDTRINELVLEVSTLKKRIIHSDVEFKTSE